MDEHRNTHGDSPERSGLSNSHHVHSVDHSSDQRLLGFALAIIVGFMIGEVAVGLVAHSLTLLADAGHMLTDAGALALSIWVIRLGLRPVSAQWTFGFKRAEILSAATNGITLLLISVVIGTEAILRLVHPQHVHGPAMIVVAVIGIGVNVLATLFVSKANQSNLNIKGVMGHLLTDLWAFIGTLVAGVLIVTTGYRRADPIASLVVVLLMVRTSWSLLKDSGRVLLEAAPPGIDLTEVRDHFLSVEHVIGIHDLHAWVVMTSLPALSAHVVIDDDCFANGLAPKILDELQSCLVGHFDLRHSTFQLEPDEHAGHEDTSH